MTLVTFARVAALPAAMVLALWLRGCSDWPPEGDGSSSNGGSESGSPSNGTCSGTPLSCSALTTQQCAATAGCLDNGVCSGSGSIGACPDFRSPSLCGDDPTCFWVTACSGTPLGNCRGPTQTSCLSAPGCVWTPYDTSTGGGGAGGTSSGNQCPSYASSCSTSAQCDCGFSCLQLCTACEAACAKSCRSDADCSSAIGAGVKTPYCFKYDINQASGACALAK
jgi:hypothetical protein